MEETQAKESFEDFIKSFFYGSRSDLSFKFLADMPAQEAARFLADLFRDAVDALDDNDLEKIRNRLLQGQIAGYKNQKNFDYADGAFTPLANPVSSLKLSLITSSGHFLKDQDPEPLGVANMTQKEAEQRVFDFVKEEPQLSKIPFSSPAQHLRVRHGGYDIRAARKDPNVSFPYQILQTFKDQGRIGSLTHDAYSFVGACSQKRLLSRTLPAWIPEFKKEQMEAAVLVPV